MWRRRLCFLNRSYHPDRGATGQLLTDLCQDLAREHGWDVTVVAGEALQTGAVRTRRRGWAPVLREVHEGVTIVRARGTTFGRGRFAGRAANYLTYLATAWLAARRVRAPDVVVALTDPPVIGLVGLGLARRSAARFVFLCQDVFPEVALLLEDFRSEAVNRWLDRVGRRLLRDADRVVALGETMRARLVEEKGARPEVVEVIPNWADTRSIVPGPRDNPFAREHGLERSFVVMHSGNVGLSQNLDVLLDAAAELRDLPDLRVVVVGEGAKRAHLEARVRTERLDHVGFLPSQPRERLTESFATADVFLVSLRPGLAGYIVPSKLYGILAAGRPYVAAVEETTEVATVTRKFDCGLVVEPGEPAALAGAIRRLYHDRDLGRRLGANARRAAADFDRRRAVAAYDALLRDVAAQGPRPRSSPAKRVFDAGLAGLGLLLSAPLWAAIALAIKAEDRGPVFFGQERVGLGGRRFQGWKFRSMVPDADRRSPPRQATERDPRVTRVGHLLRVTAMDELPQLWNILIGDMSFVGPRALVPTEIETRGNGTAAALDTVPGADIRHRVRPGLTGLAQIYAPRDIPRRHKFRYDAIYVRRQSFWLDLRLILLSFWITARGTWERRGRKF